MCRQILISFLLLTGLVAPVQASGGTIYHRTIIYSVSEAPVDLTPFQPLLADFQRVAVFTSVPENPQFRISRLQAPEKGARPPDPDYLQQFGRGLTHAELDRLALTKQALLLEFAYDTDLRYSGIQVANWLAYELANQLDGVIWDVETREMFSSASWLQARQQAWVNGNPLIDLHINLVAVQSADGIRATSLGLGKFGVPDLVVTDVPWGANGTVSDLMHLVAQGLIEQELEAGYGRFALRLADLSETPMRQKMQRVLQLPLEQPIWLEFAPAESRPTDPDNQLLELRLRYTSELLDPAALQDTI